MIEPILGVCTGSGVRIIVNLKCAAYMTSAKVKVEHSEPSLCYANYINDWQQEMPHKSVPS